MDKIIVQRKFVYPTTISPIFQTNPYPLDKLSAYRIEIIISSRNGAKYNLFCTKNELYKVFRAYMDT